MGILGIESTPLSDRVQEATRRHLWHVDQAHDESYPCILELFQLQARLEVALKIDAIQAIATLIPPLRVMSEMAILLS